VIDQRNLGSVSSDPARLGQPFGRYQLLGLLGQGGMGRLYIAERRGIEGFVKIVALKVILPQLAKGVRWREILDEARAAAKLEHPNVVVTYELGELEGKYFIAMEYLPGEDLSAIAARCQGSLRIPIEIATALAQQAGQGLHFAHETRDQDGRPLGLVHRNVNLRNVFLTYHGVVKVLDFGAVHGHEGRSGHCAPEQLDGGHVDRRTDVFCLGIVLWELLTGEPLFEGSTEAETVDAVRSKAIPAPSVLRPEIPRALDAMVLRALERAPNHRYQSAHDFSDELEGFLLERDGRPSQKSLGRWLESVFGAERAALKKAISQGAPIEGTLEKLAALESSALSLNKPASPGLGLAADHVEPRARSTWPTSFPTATDWPPVSGAVQRVSGSGPVATTLSGAAGPFGSPSGPLAASGAKRGLGAVPAVVGGLAVLGIVALVIYGGAAPRLTGAGSAAEGSRAPVPQVTGSLAIDSVPRGANVFVDGSPTGLRTPAVLSGLDIGATLHLRLDKEGFEPAAETARIESGPNHAVMLQLRSSRGTSGSSGGPSVPRSTSTTWTSRAAIARSWQRRGCTACGSRSIRPCCSPPRWTCRLAAKRSSR